jgi:hypothetical protein
MATLTDAELDRIVQVIFAAGDRSQRLARPVASGSAAFKDALDPLATAFPDPGIAVLDFTLDATQPDIWLYNEDKPFRIGSASKIAMMLAAVQLRQDVRRILDLSPQIITQPDEFDEVFRNPDLWAKAKGPVLEMKDIAGADSAPLVSKILDFNKTPIDFDGPDPDQQTTSANRKKIVDKLPADHELRWSTSPALSFSERYWLTGCLSDNVAATWCISDLGPAYIKAVQRAYGLADHPSGGMHLLASGHHIDIPKSKTTASAPPPTRQLKHVEPIPVEDRWFDKKTGGFTDKKSWLPGSAAALAAYMIALMTNGFTDSPGNASALAASRTIQRNLADKFRPSIASFMVDGPDGDGSDGIASISNIDRELNKIGILRRHDGSKTGLICEFVYLETSEPFAPAGARDKMKYAVIVAGLAPAGGKESAERSAALGIAVHRALLTL